tara:strand:- start:51 stop:305 length:255 start_codon:yes stop_codon:yes gene_type:complete
MLGKLLFHSKICTKRNALLFSNKKYISDAIVNYNIKTINNDNKNNSQNNSESNNNNSEKIKIKIKLKLKGNFLNENNPYNDRED